jgi:hypothetical protein
MIIVFDKLLTECIHDPDLHNRLRENKLKNKVRGILSVLLTNFGEYNDKTLAEVKKMRNCHFVNYGTQLKITDFFNKYAKKREVKIFVSDSNLYQLSIPNTEIRLIGNLQTNYFYSREKTYNDLFSILFIDFDHSLHKNIKKLKAKEQELICIMKERNCSTY